MRAFVNHQLFKSRAFVAVLVFCAALIALPVNSGFTRPKEAPVKTRKAYPRNFEWGSALSAHQTEGVTGGGENSDWYAFEHRSKSPIAKGHTADRGTDFWHRYPEDFAFGASLGLSTIRISLAWEKIEPRPGVFNEEVIEHYRDVLKEMRSRGMKPMVALVHFAVPLWFVRQGHWISPEAPHAFARYTRHVVKRLGDLCDLWITFNEPMIVVMTGYVNGEFPPNIKSLPDGFEAGYNLVRAHRMATAVIHEIQGPSPNARGRDGRLRGVGVVNSWQSYRPLHPWNPMDRSAAKLMAEIANWSMMRSFQNGLWKVPMAGLAALKAPRRVPDEDLAGIRGSPLVDWIGVNYYTCFDVGFRYGVAPSVAYPKGYPLADNGWAICPERMEDVLRDTAKNFPGIPLVLAENGLADGNDSRRPAFIRDHLKALDRAVLGADGQPALDIRGYYHWSLTDNFEWTLGYTKRFGLAKIHYGDNLRREPRPSAYFYKREIKKRRGH
jgi:beta-glucosidase